MSAENHAPATRRLPCAEPIDLRLTLAPLRHGPGDRTIRLEPGGVWLGLRMAGEPATLRLATQGHEIVAEAWGPGAERALDAAPGFAGMLDDPRALIARHPLVRELQRRFAGLRLPRSGQLVASLVPAVTEQKVTATEAHTAYARLLRRLSDPAPGPVPDGLLLPPDPVRLAELPSYEYHPFGLERRRAEVLRRSGRLASRIDAMIELSPEDARVLLRAIPGIGAWTAAEVTRTAFGDPDAVSIGDAHIPSMVAWALAREPRADDARMLEILEPYAGQRARVVRLLEAAGMQAPRRGPRFAPREIARL